MDEFKDKNGAYVGTCPWVSERLHSYKGIPDNVQAYGGIWRPETEHVNEFGMVWAGDPPHESPGW